MKQLTLALLLSIAPAVINAESQPCLLDVAPAMIEAENKCGSCDKSEIVDDERCCNLAELVVLDAAQAYAANQVTITVSGETVSAEGWDFITRFVHAIYGDATVEENRTVTVSFERNDLSVAAWFNLLAEVENKFVTVQGTISEHPDCTGAVVSLN